MATQRATVSSKRRLIESQKEIEASTVRLRMAAVIAEEDNNSAKVKELSDVFLDSLRVMLELKCYDEALDVIGTKYVFDVNAGPTDFESMLKKEADKLIKGKKQRLEDHPYYQAFQKAVWNVHHAGEAMPGTEDEETLMTSASIGIKNLFCPLTAKSVLDMEDPVRCTDCKHIYDREAIMAHVGGRTKKCPIAGCPTNITKAILICDGTLKMELKETRLKARGASQHEYTEL